MIISELKSYIQRHHGVARDELARHFALSEDGVDAMLEIWIRKGKLSKMIDLDNNKKVKKVKYRWIEPGGISLTTIN